LSIHRTSVASLVVSPGESDFLPFSRSTMAPVNAEEFRFDVVPERVDVLVGDGCDLLVDLDKGAEQSRTRIPRLWSKRLRKRRRLNSGMDSGMALTRGSDPIDDPS
jgi:hypothetical protein